MPSIQASIFETIDTPVPFNVSDDESNRIEDNFVTDQLGNYHLIHRITTQPPEKAACILDKFLPNIWGKIDSEGKIEIKDYLIKSITTNNSKTILNIYYFNSLYYIALYEMPDWVEFDQIIRPPHLKHPNIPIDVSFSILSCFINVIDNSPRITHTRRLELRNHIRNGNVILKQIQHFPELTISTLFNSISFYKWCNENIIFYIFSKLWKQFINSPHFLRFVYIVFYKRLDSLKFFNKFFQKKLCFVLDVPFISSSDIQFFLGKITSKHFMMIFERWSATPNKSIINYLINYFIKFFPLCSEFWKFWKKIANFLIKHIKTYQFKDFMNCFGERIYYSFIEKVNLMNANEFPIEEVRMILLEWKKLYEILELNEKFNLDICIENIRQPLVLINYEVFVRKASEIIPDQNVPEDLVKLFLDLNMPDISNKNFDRIFKLFIDRKQILPCYFTFLSRLRDNFPQCEQYWDQIFNDLIVPAIQMDIPLLISEAILLSSHFNNALGRIDYLMSKCISFLNNYETIENINIIKAIERFIIQTKCKILKKYDLDLLCILIDFIKMRNNIPKVIMKYYWKLLIHIFQHNKMIESISMWLQIFNPQNEQQINRFNTYFPKFIKRLYETLQSQQKKDFKNAIKDIIAVICFECKPEDNLFGFDDAE